MIWRVQNLWGQAVQVVGHRAARTGDELALVSGICALLAHIAGVLRTATHKAHEHLLWPVKLHQVVSERAENCQMREMLLGMKMGCR